MAVALHSSFSKTLPSLPEVKSAESNLAWLIYDLQLDGAQNRYDLARAQTIYTRFQPALEKITTSEPGPIEDFIEHLQERLDEKLENGNPPDAPTLTDILEP